jgi:hypothetical protein
MDCGACHPGGEAFESNGNCAKCHAPVGGKAQ